MPQVQVGFSGLCLSFPYSRSKLAFVVLYVHMVSSFSTR